MTWYFVIQSVKNLPAVQETRVRSLGWEDPLEKEMATTTVFLPGKSHGQKSVVGCSPWGRKESDMTERLTLTLTHLWSPVGASDFNLRLSNLFPAFRWSNDLGRLLKLSLPSQELVWPCLSSPPTGNTSPSGLSPSGPPTRILLTETWSFLRGEASPAP